MAKVAMHTGGTGTRERGSLLVDRALAGRRSGAGVTAASPYTPRVNPTIPIPPSSPNTVAPTTPPAAPNAGTPSVAPSVLPKYGDPLAGFDPAAFLGGAGNYGSQFNSGGDFTPMDIDTSGDPGFEALLRSRMAGEGVVGWEEIERGAYDPYARIVDREADRATDQAVETMISRGVLDSSEAGRAISDIALEAADRKYAKLGELGLMHEQMKQESINSAISQFGILEGNKLQAKTTITAANIGAAASIKSAAIGAGATVQAASISAQARLQEAGLNARVALESLQRQMDMSLVEQGIDPVAFANDPEYRGGLFEYYEILRLEELELIKLLNRGKAFDSSAGPRP